MKIGIDARFYGKIGKGLGRYTQKLLEHLEKIDRINTYYVFLRQSNWDEYHPVAPNFKKILADFRWYTLQEQLKFPKLLNKFNLDLVHFTHFNVPFFYSGKFIVTIHDLILTKYPTERATTLGPIWYSLKLAGYRFVIRQAVRKAAKIIAVSNFTKQDIVTNFPQAKNKTEVIYEGVDRLSGDSDDYRGVISKYRLPANFLLYVGNAYPHKNLERLLQSMKIVIRSMPDYGLVIAGKDDYFINRIKSFSFQLGLDKNVYFTGFVNDTEKDFLFKKSLIFVFPSIYEGFGLPVAEAMKKGIPVLTSNISSLPEIVGKDYPFLVNPEDVLDIKDKLERLLRLTPKEKEKIVLENKQKASRFTWGRNAEKWLKIVS